jgi:hypothetical protein
LEPSSASQDIRELAASSQQAVSQFSSRPNRRPSSTENPMISHAFANPHVTPAFGAKVRVAGRPNRHAPYDVETPLLVVAHLIRFFRDTGKTAASIWTKIPHR